MRLPLRLALLTAGIALVILACTQPHKLVSDETATQPNFLFLLVDDLGWADISPNRPDTFYETPNLERLARSGVRFSNAYAACPVCSPTRASLLTGRYPARMATTDWFGAPQPERVRKNGKRKLLPAPYLDHMPLERVTLTEALREAGYATFFAGKWHLGGEGYSPLEQGFEINRGGFKRGSPPGGYFSPYKNPALEDGPEGEHLTGRLTEESIAFLEERAKSPDQPFLLYLSYYAVHTPLQGRPDLVERAEKRRESLEIAGELFGREGARQVRLVQEHAVYAAMVESMDESVGRLLDTLDRTGLADDTVIVLFSDNGGLSTSEGHPTSNLPLRAGKGWLYEGGVRVPCLVRWPGKAAPGTTCDVPVVSTDFYPTFLEMAGLPRRQDEHVDGKSLVPLLRAPEQATLDRETIYWHYPHYGNQGGAPGSALRQGDLKLIEHFEDGRVELFDLAADPGETNDLAAARADTTARLRARLAAWREEVGARLPTPNPSAR